MSDGGRTAAIGDFVTKDMFEQIKKICSEEKRDGKRVTRITREVMRPNMDEINRKLGQVNEPRYLAYAVLHALNQCGA